MSEPILLINPDSEILYQFPIEELEQAYIKALELEEIGVEFELKVPSLPETLASTLGASRSETDQLKEEIIKEIDDHNTPSCQ